MMSTTENSKAAAQAGADQVGTSEILDIYLYYAEQTEKLIERRAANSRYFLTINTAFVSLLGLAIKYGSAAQSVWLLGVPVAGIAICVVWARLTHSYRILTGARYQVICDLEQRLEFAPYSEEWKRIETEQGSRYVSISNLERVVPWVFVLIYLILLLSFIIVAGQGP